MRAEAAPRGRLLVAALALVPLGLATKAYAGPGQGWVQGYAGGVVYVVFWTLGVAALRPSLAPRRAAAGVLAATSALECLQLWHPPLLEAARGTFLGQALLGSHFSWADFPHYVVGAAAGAWLAGVLGPGRDPPAPG